MDYSILIPDCINYYLDGFKKTEYPACFRHYCQRTEGIFQEISIRDPEACARELVDWMDAHPGRFFRARRLADRQMLLLQYTAPAALQMGQEAFAHALSRIWNKRHPQYPFQVASYQELFKGFNNTILGFQLPKEEE